MTPSSRTRKHAQAPAPAAAEACGRGPLEAVITTAELELRPMLIGHEAGNGGHSQAFAYGPPRRMSTRQIRMHGLNGGLDRPGRSAAL